MTRASSGTAATAAASPAAAASAIAPMPSAVPRTCGSVRRKPNAAPDAQSRTLFGPGVKELTNEKPTRARGSPSPLTLAGRRRPVLRDLAIGAPDPPSTSADVMRTGPRQPGLSTRAPASVATTPGAPRPWPVATRPVGPRPRAPAGAAQDPHELRRRRRAHLGPGVRQVRLDGRVRQAEAVRGRLLRPGLEDRGDHDDLSVCRASGGAVPHASRLAAGAEPLDRARPGKPWALRSTIASRCSRSALRCVR